MCVSVYTVLTACRQYLDAFPINFTMLRSAVQYLSSWRERYGISSKKRDSPVLSCRASLCGSNRT